MALSTAGRKRGRESFLEKTPDPFFSPPIPNSLSPSTGRLRRKHRASCSWCSIPSSSNPGEFVPFFGPEIPDPLAVRADEPV